MPKPNPGLYDLRKTAFWFAVISIVLLVSLVWMVKDDYTREWKGWQATFVRLKTEKLKKELAEAKTQVDKQKLGELQKQHAEALRVQEGQKKERRALEKELEKIDLEASKARARFQNTKQFLDSYKYYYEEAGLHGGKRTAEKYLNRMKPLQKRLDAQKAELEILEKKQEDLLARKAEAEAAVKELDRQTADLLKEQTRLERGIERIEPTLVTGILNAPMADFLAPTLRVQQVVVDSLYDDYHFARVQKVDRCTTCHLGIDQKGYEDAPQPFRTHPKLELFVGSESPHALEKFGCTTCHGGNGHSVGFANAAHMPSSEEQAREWKKKYGWRPLEKWDAKMFPRGTVEASCAKCHAETVRVPEAPRLNEGRRLAEASGCFNCHLVKGFEGSWKVGPDLGSISSKVDGDWILRWLNDPKSFRESAKMPRIFHLSNTSGPEDRERNLAMIEGIAAYLEANSGPVRLEAPPVAGDAERGAALVKQVGCVGCHSVGGQGGDFAPELSGLGSKVKADWLYNWVKDPKHFSAATRMPNLRLSDQEAADITSYLLTLKNEAFEQTPVPQAKPEAVDEMALTFLKRKMRGAEAQEKLKSMDDRAKRVFLGKEAIAHQGCFGCHAIKGFENAKSIGTELSEEGSKDIHQFDFGYLHLEHTRPAWLFQKLKEPRVYDKGKIKDYLDKLRMPQFDFTDEEAQALTTFLLSLTREYVPLEMQKRLDAREQDVERGRRLAAKFNCQGCHTLDGREGILRKLMAEDIGNAPPRLDGEGAKVHEKWLHEFIHDPSTIRPWLKVRMPTFSLSDEEISDLVRYFAGLSNAEVSYKGIEAPPTTPERLEVGKGLFKSFQCAKCHQGAQAGLTASFLAPDLKLTPERLKPEWVAEWLKDPQKLEEGTMMPTFFPDGQTPLPDVLGGDYLEQIKAIRDYLYHVEDSAGEPAPGSEAP